MDATRWTRVQDLFHDAAALPPPERAAFLARACGPDITLHADLVAMLAADAAGTTPLDRDVADLAKEVLDVSASPPTAIRTIGPYRLTSLLGEGGMGVVYLAEREDLASRVAIKLLRDAWVSPARRERFTSEQRTLAQLDHPCIARIHDADTLPDGTPWFAMEYVDGVPITEYCREHVLSVDERLRLFLQVCDAVLHAHQHLVVHRDLKPSNVLVSRDGRVKLLDFGIARHLDPLDDANSTTTVERFLSPAYAAPEQLRGEPTGMHTDVYALGVLLYELLAGRRPFDVAGLTPAEVSSRIIDGDADRPSVVSRQVAPPGVMARRAQWADLDVLCATAMRKEAPRRYPTVDALARDVDAYLRGKPLSARAESWGYRGGKFIRRHRRGLAVAAGAVVALAMLAGLHIARIETAHRAALVEAARTQRIQRFMLSLFSAGETQDAPAADLRVVTLLERGVNDARRLDAEPAVQAELHQTLGTIYQQLGSLDQANTLLETALAQRRALHEASHPEVIESLVALGNLRVEQASLDEAERLLREAYRHARAVVSPEHPLRAETALALGRAVRERGAYDEAVPLLDEAVHLYGRDTTPDDDLAAALTALANTHFYAGRLDLADTLYQRIVTMSRSLHGPRHPSVAHDLLNLSATASARGRYTEAETYTRQAVDIFDAWYGRDHPETGSALVILGQALRFQEKFAEAETALREALATQERVYGASHPRVAFALNELGGVAQRQGAYAEAEMALQRALAIYSAAYDGRHSRVGVVMSNLGWLCVARRDFARAETLLRSALTLYGELLPETHVNIAIARIRLGVALVEQQRFDEAEPLLVRAYEVLRQGSSRSPTWEATARQTLATVYDGLRQPDKARQFRTDAVGAQ